MAGLLIPSIQTVTTKVQLSQSSVLGNTFLEDTPVCHGVSDLNLFHYITGHSSSSCKSAMIILYNSRSSSPGACVPVTAFSQTDLFLV